MREDTVRLLDDCAVGLCRTVWTIEELLPVIKDHTLRGRLRESQQQYADLLERSDRLLRQQGRPGKASMTGAKGAAWLKANAGMALRRDDTAAAYVMAEECDRRVKALCRSRNLYCSAADHAVELSGEIIAYQEKLSRDMRPFL